MLAPSVRIGFEGPFFYSIQGKSKASDSESPLKNPSPRLTNSGVKYNDRQNFHFPEKAQLTWKWKGLLEQGLKLFAFLSTDQARTTCPIYDELNWT